MVWYRVCPPQALAASCPSLLLHLPHPQGCLAPAQGPLCLLLLLLLVSQLSQQPLAGYLALAEGVASWLLLTQQ